MYEVIPTSVGWIGRYPNYQNNDRCSWLITPPSGYDYMAFTFYLLQTEASYDYVRIYDGNSNAGSPFASYSGAVTVFQPITNTQVHIEQFHS